MDIQRKIDLLCRSLDKQTVSLSKEKSNKLLLLGQQDSLFLKSIKRKADSLGVPCDFGKIIPSYTGVVADKESSGSVRFPIMSDVDVDCLKSPGMSSAARAVLYLLMEQKMVSGKTITIVGRGHAVKGLAQALIEENATVTVAHSKTPDLYRATEDKDVVIYATPILTQYPCFNTRDLVIDLGNCFTENDRESFKCDFVGNIGRLTVSVLLNSFAKYHDRIFVI